METVRVKRFSKARVIAVHALIGGKSDFWPEWDAQAFVWVFFPELCRRCDQFGTQPFPCFFGEKLPNALMREVIQYEVGFLLLIQKVMADRG